jgi:hypothetical protein
MFYISNDTGTSNNTIPLPTVNHPPIANAGTNQIANESSKVMLVGAAVDPDPNDKLSYSWLQIRFLQTLPALNSSP